MKKLSSIVLFGAIGLLLLLPLAASADNAATIAAQLTGIPAGGSGAGLTAAVSGDMVTVTGTVTGATSTLTLNLDQTVRVLWKANYAANSTLATTIKVNGGTFEVNAQTISGSTATGSVTIEANCYLVVSGGTISSTSTGGSGGAVLATGSVHVAAGLVTAYNRAIFASGTTIANIIVDGSGEVVGNGYGIYADADKYVYVGGNGKVESGVNGTAIRSAGDVSIRENGVVNNPGTPGSAIEATGTAAKTITISGGTITSSSSFGAVLANANKSIVVSDSGKVIANGARGIYCEGSTVTVTGGEVRSTSSTATSTLSSTGAINISGGTISSATANAVAVAGKDVVINGNARVEATVGGAAVSINGNLSVSENAVIISASNRAIYAYTYAATPHTIAISGGTVSSGIATNTYAVVYANAVNKVILVSDSAKIMATAGTGKAILTRGDVSMTGGLVSAIDNCAIQTDSAIAKTISISGGLVTSGLVNTNAVIYAHSPEKTVLISGSARIEATGNFGNTIYANGDLIVSGGEVISTSGYAVNAVNTGKTVTVCDSGKVISTGAGAAIYASGNIDVSGNAIVNSNGNNAITTNNSAAATITLTGGVVSGGTSSVINSVQAAKTILISDTAKIQAAGAASAILYSGNASISGGEITSVNGAAIAQNHNVQTLTISDSAKVTASGTGKALSVRDDLYISGNALVSAVSGLAIEALSANTHHISISGGTVSASTGTVISLGTNKTIAVSDSGKVYANNGTAIYSLHNVVVKGNGIVRSANGSCIVASGAFVQDNALVDAPNAIAIEAVNGVTVSGGVVKNAELSEPAIKTTGVGATVLVSGGLVFSYDTAIIGGVIQFTHQANVTNPGVVIAWDAGKNVTSYIPGATTDILVSPVGATATWAKNGSEYGIAYTNTGVSGFIALPVTVSTAPVLSTGSTGSVNCSGAILHFSSTKAADGYCVIYPDTATAPDAATIEAQSMYTTAITPTTQTLNVSGLTHETTYIAYIIAKDADDSLSNILAIPFTTSTAIYHPIDIAVINSMIANNGLSWTPATPCEVPVDWVAVAWSADAVNKRITHLNFYYQGIQLTGQLNISPLTELVVLNCDSSQLTVLDVWGCTALRNLDCNGNQLTQLNVSGCNSLYGLSCHDNQLTTLDVSGLTDLWVLHCENNNLATLNVSGCTALEGLYCYENQLTALDVSTCSLLEALNCSGNQISALNITGLANLNILNCNNNQLPALDVSGFTNLATLSCLRNAMTTLNVSGCNALRFLDCDRNPLTALDVSSCTILESLSCNLNYLTTLNVSGLSALLYLQCHTNNLTALDLSTLTALLDLDCGYNKLDTLDVSGCSALADIRCQHNRLTELDVTDCDAVLTLLDCSFNYMEDTLKVVGFTHIWDDQNYVFYPQHADGFIPVVNIVNMPLTTAVSTPLTLTGTVVPSDATNQDIVWTVHPTDTTGAVINGNIFTALRAGTSRIVATVVDGIATDIDFILDVLIAVTASTTSYNINIGSFTGGSVTSTQPTAVAGEDVELDISCDYNVYKLDTIWIHQTGNSSVVIPHTGSGNSRWFVMPAYDVTVEAAFVLKSGIVGAGRALPLRVYPNPTRDNITIVLPEGVTDALFTIYDLQGRALLRRNLTDNKETVSVVGLSAGMYTYSLSTETKQYNGRMVKR